MKHEQTSYNSEDSLQNLMAATAYLVWFVSGILIYLLERREPFARFHAIQSIVTFFILFILLGILKAIFGFESWYVVGMIVIIVSLQLFLMVRALGGVYVKVPLVGAWIERNFLA